MSSSHIAYFWAENKQFWFPVTPEEKHTADTVIFDLFYDYDYEQENLPGRCIFLDQFQRHFQRILGSDAITEEVVRAKREEAVEDVERNADELICYKETDLVACLMPFKHLGRFEYIFEYLHNTYLPDMGWSSEEASLLKNHPILSRFYADTYKKAFTDVTIADSIIRNPLHPVDQYDASAICESADLPPLGVKLAATVAFHPEAIKLGNLLADCLADDLPIVSLSGGVDSMVALTLLKAYNYNPVAVHIIYGNRGVSSAEYSFIATYCKHLDVPLYAFEIPYIRREQVERSFYEKATRELRFAMYRVVAAELVAASPSKSIKVILGHIKDDLVENVWTNFAKGQHLDNLAKMEVQEEQLGVTLLRPFLNVSKSLILDVAGSISIPYLKNTTPSWSNRGKFREHFYAATQEQYGPQVDNAILQTAAILKTQTAIIEKLLYDRIYRTWNVTTSSIQITADEAQFLDTAGWLKVFEHICHKFLHISRPSIHAVREFQRRLSTPVNPLKVNMKKDLQVIVDDSTIIFTIVPLIT